MIKLCKNGQATKVYLPYIYPKGYFNDNNEMECTNRENYLISPLIYFSKNHKDDDSIILYETEANQYLLLTKDTILMLSKITDIRFTFYSVLPDTPVDPETIKDINVKINCVDDILKAFANYIRYKMIAYLPYADFAIDHMPIISEVYINNKPSNLFDDIIDILNTEIQEITSIIIDKHAYWSYKYKNDPSIKTKKLYNAFIRINNGYPLFYKFTKEKYKIFRNIDRFEVSLRWYNKNKYDYNTTLEDSDIDDYIYSDIGFTGILTFEACYKYLISYYCKELRDMKPNYFLIAIVSCYMNINKSKFNYQYPVYYNNEMPEYYYSYSVLNRAFNENLSYAY